MTIFKLRKNICECVTIFTNTDNVHVKSVNFHGESHNCHGKPVNVHGFYTNFDEMY